MRPGPALLLALFAVLLAGGGCRGCTESLSPESPEAAAELWGKLHCDRRESLVSLQITDLKNRKDILRVRSKLVAGGIAAEDDVNRAEALIAFIDAHGRELLVCEREVVDRTSRGDGGKEWVELALLFPRIAVSPDPNADEPFTIAPQRLELGVEVTQLDGAWRITGEPAGMPTDADLSLFLADSGDGVRYDPPAVPSSRSGL